MKFIDALPEKDKKLFYWLIIVQPTHPSIDNLISNELIFLPPNTISRLQPMDQGVIRSLKAYYKTMSIKKLIEATEKKKAT